MKLRGSFHAAATISVKVTMAAAKILGAAADFGILNGIRVFCLLPGKGPQGLPAVGD